MNHSTLGAEFFNNHHFAHIDEELYRDKLQKALEEVFKLILIHPSYQANLKLLGFDFTWQNNLFQKLEEIRNFSRAGKNRSNSSEVNQLVGECMERCL